VTFDASFHFCANFNIEAAAVLPILKIFSALLALLSFHGLLCLGARAF